MASRKVHIEGLSELDAALGELPKASAKGVLRRVLKKRAQPMADTAKSLAPDDPATSGKNDLKTSIGVGTKLTKRQAGLHRKMFKNDRASVEIFVGAGGLVQATQQEFGNSEHPAQPFMRPAWDQHKDSILEGIGADLWSEIEKTAKRVAKRNAKLSAKG